MCGDTDLKVFIDSISIMGRLTKLRSSIFVVEEQPTMVSIPSRTKKMDFINLSQ